MPLELVMEAEGFKKSDHDGIYPDNWQTVGVFLDMLTQWRTGMNGATGLDYTALPVVLRIRKVALAEREDVFNGLQVMERAALTHMRRK